MSDLFHSSYNKMNLKKTLILIVSRRFVKGKLKRQEETRTLILLLSLLLFSRQPHSLSSSCLVPRPHYSARPVRLGSRGTSEFLRSSGRPSQIRHRNALTEKAWEGAVQGLGNCGSNLTTNCDKYLQLKNQNVATFEIADHDSYERTSWSSDLIHFLLLTKVFKNKPLR